MKLDIYSIIENDEIECKEAAGGYQRIYGKVTQRLPILMEALYY